MRIEVALFGALRQWQPDGVLVLEIHRPADVRAVRRQLAAHAAAYWPGCPPELLQACAVATEREVLHEGDPLPADARLALLPPVSGG